MKTPPRKKGTGVRTAKSASFNYDLDFSKIDFRKRPELY